MAATPSIDTSREQRERLEIEQIRSGIEESRANTTLAAKRARWYELVLAAAAGAGLVTLGIAVGEFFRAVPKS